jgi:hypothetical protein
MRFEPCDFFLRIIRTDTADPILTAQFSKIPGSQCLQCKLSRFTFFHGIYRLSCSGSAFEVLPRASTNWVPARDLPGRQVSPKRA